METNRDAIERAMLAAIYAWSSTPAATIAAAKANGISAEAFSTSDRRLVWLIAEAARDREHVVGLVHTAVLKGDLVPEMIWLVDSWGKSELFFGSTPEERVGYRAKELRGLTLSSSRPTMAAALSLLKGV
jgi:hypothetical protein